MQTKPTLRSTCQGPDMGVLLFVYDRELNSVNRRKCKVGMLVIKQNYHHNTYANMSSYIPKCSLWSASSDSWHGEG